MSTDALEGTVLSGEEVVRRLRESQALIDGAAAADPWADRIQEDVVEAALIDSGLLRLWLPRAIGGGEASCAEMIAAIEELAYADGGAGWVGMAAVLATTTASAYLDDEAVSALYGGPRPPVIEGAGAPSGVAEKVEGGYRLTGRWQYGSGVKHATHIYSGAIVHEDGKPAENEDGSPRAILTVVPHEDVEFGENWDVFGLRSTGSIDYAIDDVFVPEAYAHDALARSSTRGGRLYELGVMGAGCLLHGAWATGLARRALDEQSSFAALRRDRGDSEEVRLRAAHAHAAYLGSKAFLDQVWAGVDARIEAGEALSTEQDTMIRLAVRHVTDVARDVCTTAFQIAGGAGLRAGPIQRCFRDAAASGQHIIVSDLILAGCGEAVLGLGEGKVWRHAVLVPDADLP